MKRQWGDGDRWLIFKGAVNWHVFKPMSEASRGASTTFQAATFPTFEAARAAFAAGHK